MIHQPSNHQTAINLYGKWWWLFSLGRYLRLSSSWSMNYDHDDHDDNMLHKMKNNNKIDV